MLAVLVDSHAELDVVAAQSVVTRDDVSSDLLERMADVRLRVWIVDGSGDVELVRHAVSPGCGARGRAGSLGTSAEAVAEEPRPEAAV